MLSVHAILARLYLISLHLHVYHSCRQTQISLANPWMYLCIIFGSAFLALPVILYTPGFSTICNIMLTGYVGSPLPAILQPETLRAHKMNVYKPTSGTLPVTES